MAINGYACTAAGAELTPFSYQRSPLPPYGVRLRITHCGICHSDIHLIDNDWQISSYPFIPGHEIIGIVTDAGEAVTHLRAGDRAGIGWQSGSCFACSQCSAGHEQRCNRSQATCVGRHGGYANETEADARFAFKIPDALESAATAPLLCGGVTVFSPLLANAAGPETSVGVIGIGGLGHMALRFAAAMGCRVTALTATPEKLTEALNYGAADAIVSTDDAMLKQRARTLDLILSTAAVTLNWQRVLGLLKPGGRLVLQGAPREPIPVHAMQLVSGELSVSGSAIGSRATITAMLAFAARHGIGAEVERFTLNQVNTAIARVRSNRVRYRAVLEMP